MTQRFNLDVPPIFAQDHADRDLPTGKYIGQTASGHHRYSCTLDELREWLSDANHYSDCASEGWDFAGQLGMQSSARATAKRTREVIAKAKETVT